MIDDDGRGAPSRLDAFAGIVDDERVEVWYGAENRAGEAIRRQSDALARQPLEIAMLAEMNDRIDGKDLAQPEIEGEIVVGRHEGGIVGRGLRIDVVAARRLDADNDVAESMQAEAEATVRDVR